MGAIDSGWRTIRSQRQARVPGCAALGSDLCHARPDGAARAGTRPGPPRHRCGQHQGADHRSRGPPLQHTRSRGISPRVIPWRARNAAVRIWPMPICSAARCGCLPIFRRGSDLRNLPLSQEAGASGWSAWVHEPLTSIRNRHDELVAWVSHLPQFTATALSALLEDEVGEAPELKDVGGRALREMTRLGASPFPCGAISLTPTPRPSRPLWRHSSSDWRISAKTCALRSCGTNSKRPIASGAIDSPAWLRYSPLAYNLSTCDFFFAICASVCGH